MDASQAFAAHAVRCRFADLPPPAIAATRLDVMDYIACILGGSNAAGIPEIVSLARDLAGKGEATLFVHGGKASLLETCLANGAMAHALDYDSTHEGAFLHPSVHTITAALTLADRMGGVSGQEFITAVALGADFIARLGLAYPVHPAGFMWTMVYGYLGCALTAARLLQLDEAQTVSAIGLAYAQAAGTQQGNVDGTLDKRMMVGFAARGGVLAALMAQKGITGARNSIDGTRGLYFSYANRGQRDAASLLDGLGTRYEGVNLSFKPYPACRFNHGHIDAALALAARHDLRPDEIESVVVHVEREGHSQVVPLEVKRNPRTLVDAQFSMPYTVACALVRRHVRIDDFTPVAIADPVVVAVANKVSAVVDLSLRAHVPPAAVVEVVTRRGTFRSRVEYPSGHPLNPISEEAVADKLRDCATHAARPFPSARVEEIIATVRGVLVLADMRQLAALLG